MTFISSHAITADLVQVDAAQKRLDRGESPEQVLADTGWMQSPNGLRQELSDHLAAPKFAGDTFGDVFHNASQESGVATHNLTVSDVFNHPGLFKAYPELAGIRLACMKPDDPDASRYVDHGTIQIMGFRPDLSPEDLMAELTGQLQARIQDIDRSLDAEQQRVEALLRDFDNNTGAQNSPSSAKPTEQAPAQKATAAEAKSLSHEEALLKAFDEAPLLNEPMMVNSGFRQEIESTRLRRDLSDDQRRVLPPSLEPVAAIEVVKHKSGGQEMLAQRGMSAHEVKSLFQESMPSLYPAIERALTDHRLQAPRIVVREDAAFRSYDAVQDMLGRDKAETSIKWRSKDVLNHQTGFSFHDHTTGTSYLNGGFLNEGNAVSAILTTIMRSPENKALNKLALDMVNQRDSEKNPETRQLLEQVAQGMKEGNYTKDGAYAAALILEGAATKGAALGQASADSKFNSFVDNHFGDRAGAVVKSLSSCLRNLSLKFGVGLGTPSLDEFVSLAKQGIEKSAEGPKKTALNFGKALPSLDVPRNANPFIAARKEPLGNEPAPPQQKREQSASLSM